MKERRPDIRVVGADPLGSIFKGYKERGELIEGSVYKVEGIGQDKIPETAWMDYIDEFHDVSDKDSFVMARRLAREEALFVGGSSGTATTVALKIAAEIDDPDKSVIVFLTGHGRALPLQVPQRRVDAREIASSTSPHRTSRSLLLQKPATASPLVSVESKTSIQAALALMSEHNVSQMPVIDHGESVGSTSESKLMSRVLEKKAKLEDPIAGSMEPPFPVVGGNESIEYVSRLLGRDNSALVVRIGGELTGILTRFDVIQSMSN